MTFIILAPPQEAAEHNRLASDTYKRLAVGLLYFSVLSIVLHYRYHQVLGGPVLFGCVCVGSISALLVDRSTATVSDAMFLHVLSSARLPVAGKQSKLN